MSEPALHPDLEPLAFLIGSWSGSGAGEYPSIEPFSYTETVTFGHVGKPFLAYQQRTARVPDGFPLHAESGYWRAPGAGVVELVLAHPTGIVEVYDGTATGTRLDLRTLLVGRTPTAKDVTMLERTFEVDGDVMRYTVRMAATGHELTHHLAAELHRQRG
jgi:hypothetical protein